MKKINYTLMNNAYRSKAKIIRSIIMKKMGILNFSCHNKTYRREEYLRELYNM